jgi:hypothetical protein
VQLETRLPESGLSVQVLVDPVAFKGIPALEALKAEDVIWRHVISIDEKISPAANSAAPPVGAPEQHHSNNLLGEATPKAAATSGNPSAHGTKSAPSESVELSDALAEDNPQKLVSGANASGGSEAATAAPAQPPPNTGAAGGSSPLPENLVESTAGASRYIAASANLPYREGGLDGDAFSTLYLRFEPLLTTRSGKSTQEGVSALEMGKVLLEAMIIVKMSPGGSGPQPNTTPGLISNTDSLMRVAEIVKESSQFLARIVRGFYQRYLGRDPENGEDAGWTNMLLGGDKEETVLSAFLSTREFSQRAEALVPAGTPDERFLSALYQLVLGRAAEPAELESWLQGASLDRQQASLALVRSIEFRTQQIAGFLQEALSREATPSELEIWANTPFDLLSIRNLIRSTSENPA